MGLPQNHYSPQQQNSVILSSRTQTIPHSSLLPKNLGPVDKNNTSKRTRTYCRRRKLLFLIPVIIPNSRQLTFSWSKKVILVSFILRISWMTRPHSALIAVCSPQVRWSLQELHAFDFSFLYKYHFIPKERCKKKERLAEKGQTVKLFLGETCENKGDPY